MSRIRQQRQAEKIRERILETARRIIAEEGPEKLSIRRITNEMDYSAGSIYHYFQSKDEILHQILLEGYEKILASIRLPLEELPPEEAVRSSIRGYMEGVLQWPEEYRAVMFSSQAEILAVTSVLDRDAGEKRKAVKWLADTVEKGVEEGTFAPCDPVLTAQALWCAMFGMIARVMIEGKTDLPRTVDLAERQIDILLKGLKR